MLSPYSALTQGQGQAPATFSCPGAAVEAGIDPGAEIIDRAQAALAFATIFERWLRDRLSGVRAASDPIARTADSDPIHTEELLRELAGSLSPFYVEVGFEEPHRP